LPIDDGDDDDAPGKGVAEGEVEREGMGNELARDGAEEGGGGERRDGDVAADGIEGEEAGREDESAFPKKRFVGVGFPASGRRFPPLRPPP